MELKTINSIKHNIKKVREEKNEHKDFYVVRLSPPTSTPPSSPGLRISLSKSPKVQVLYNWLPKCQWTFTIKRLSPQSLHPKCFSHLYTHNLMRNENYNKQLSFRVDIQMITQWRFNLWWFAKWRLNICCVHLFMPAKITKNELDLSLYCLN